jgi:hypothetical protein
MRCLARPRVSGALDSTSRCGVLQPAHTAGPRIAGRNANAVPIADDTIPQCRVNGVAQDRSGRRLLSGQSKKQEVDKIPAIDRLKACLQARLPALVCFRASGNLRHAKRDWAKTCFRPKLARQIQ